MTYVLNIASGGQTHEFAADNDYDAELQAITILADIGHIAPTVADDGQLCERLLFWADDDAAENDAGESAIAELRVVRV